MWTPIALLVLACFGLLFVFEVLLGHPGPGLDGAAIRLGAREFATRLAPLFLAGVGLPLLGAAPPLGGGFLALALILFTLRPRRGSRP